MKGGPQAVVFDNDGLLLDTEDAWTRSEETLFARRKRVFTLDHKRLLIGSAHTVAALKLEAMLEMRGEGEALMEELHGLVMEEALAGVRAWGEQSSVCAWAYVVTEVKPTPDLYEFPLRPNSEQQFGAFALDPRQRHRVHAYDHRRYIGHGKARTGD